MKDTIVAFFKQHWPRAVNAPLMVAAIVVVAMLVVALFSLWVAKITGVSDGFLRLADVVLSSRVVTVGVIAAAVVWVVKLFEKQIGDIIDRIREVGGRGFKASFDKMRDKPTSEMAKLLPAAGISDEIKKKAEAGDAEAQFMIGLAYALGDGVPQNYAEAAKWWRKAADQGYANAQFNLGVSYAQGAGVSQDSVEATKWYRRAAEQGDAEAQNNLGVMYRKGEGVSQDDAEATKWYHRAAEQGDAVAQNNLGGTYLLGEGVPQNFYDAYVWLAVSAANGNPNAPKNRDMAAKKLSGEDLAAAQAEAKNLHGEIQRKRAEKRE